MLDVRFNSGIGAWINGRVVVICLIDYSLHIFSEVSFSQMNNSLYDVHPKYLSANNYGVVLTTHA